MTFALILIIFSTVFISISIIIDYPLCLKIVASIILICGVGLFMWFENRLVERIIELERKKRNGRNNTGDTL